MVTYNPVIDTRNDRQTEGPPSDDIGDGDGVFKALADGGRRRLLDALHRDDGQTLGQLCDVLPAMTRFGVMKHLAILETAGLVIAHRSGRSKLHFLNPVPICEIQARWITKYAQPTLDAMVGLRRELESDTA